MTKMKITKPFKKADVLMITQGFHMEHRALDWFPRRGKLAYGTPLVAPERVLIEKIYGNNLTNNDAELINGYGVWMQGLETGYKHLYWHTLPILPVSSGDTVERGKIVAYCGNSGNVESGGSYVPISERLNKPHLGTHLHQSVFENGVSFDPLTIMDMSTEPTYTLFDFIKAFTEVLARITKLIS